MMEIWKYVLKPGKQTLELSEGAEILHVHEQRGEVCLWAQVHPTGMKVDRRICVVATGQGFIESDMAEYLGSVHLDGGALVFHVFEMYTA